MSSSPVSPMPSALLRAVVSRVLLALACLALVTATGLAAPWAATAADRPRLDARKAELRTALNLLAARLQPSDTAALSLRISTAASLPRLDAIEDAMLAARSSLRQARSVGPDGLPTVPTPTGRAALGSVDPRSTQALRLGFDPTRGTWMPSPDGRH